MWLCLAERSSQVENGLFTLTGVGLIPWRVRDTYREPLYLSLSVVPTGPTTGMAVIWQRQRLITTRRNERGLPPIEDPNDLPDPKEAADYISVRALLRLS